MRRLCLRRYLWGVLALMLAILTSALICIVHALQHRVGVLLLAEKDLGSTFKQLLVLKLTGGAYLLAV
jgi:hypothetical protein